MRTKLQIFNISVKSALCYARHVSDLSDTSTATTGSLTKKHREEQDMALLAVRWKGEIGTGFAIFSGKPFLVKSDLPVDGINNKAKERKTPKTQRRSSKAKGQQMGFPWVQLTS